jgi:NTE family protein
MKGTELGLVIGGGGIWGIAWEIGVLKALEDSGASLKNADVVIGTSAGAIVGAQYFGDRTIDEMLREQQNPAGWLMKATKTLPKRKPKQHRSMVREAESQAERSLRLSHAAAQSRVPIPSWLYTMIIRKVLRVSDWPKSTHFLAATTDCETGRVKLWRSSDGVPIGRAVAASCCVPGVFPPIMINGRRYVDGGCGSANNFDKIIETNVGRAVCIGPFGGEHSPELGQERRYLSEGIERVKQAGIEVLVITPGEGFVAKAGDNGLNPAVSPVLAACGIADGHRFAKEVKEFIA